AALRGGRGPHFLELVTYRWRGHVGPRDDEDVGVQRRGDLTLWKRRDPVRRAAEALVRAELTDDNEIVSMREHAYREVEQAWLESSGDPYPETTVLLE